MGVPNTSEWNLESSHVHKWAEWLRHPYYPQRLIVGHQINNGPLLGGFAIINPVLKCVPNTLEAEKETSRGSPMGGLPMSTCRLRGAQRFKGKDKISSGPQVSRLTSSPQNSTIPGRLRAGDKISNAPQGRGSATAPLPLRVSTTQQRGEQNKQWPTSGWIGAVTPAV